MKYSIKDFMALNKTIEKEEKLSKNNLRFDAKQEEMENTEETTDEEGVKQPDKSDVGYIREREAELMRQLYSEINKFLYPFVVQVLDEFEFIGSPIYSISGIDRETISQMVDRVLELAEKSLDQVGEVVNERTSNYLREWDRWGLLRATVESLLLNDIFSIRRPIYYKNYAPNILR